MKKYFYKLFILALGLTISFSSFANQKITVLLDWFANPVHAGVIVAQQKGYFTQRGLDVKIVEPTDPALPSKLVAAGKADVAYYFQPQLQIAVDQGLPLVRVATLVASPLNTLMVLKDSKIKNLADLKGKKIGYAVPGFEDSILKAMLATVNLKLSDVEMININWSIVPSLISGKVDAVVGGIRNFEPNEMDLEKHPALVFYPEEHGVPSYDEAILVANKNNLDQEKLSKFLDAVEQANIFILNHSQKAWEAFVSFKPKELDTEINRLAWRDTLPRLSLSPRALDEIRYQRVAQFLKDGGLIKEVKPVSEYAIQIK